METRHQTPQGKVIVFMISICRILWKPSHKKNLKTKTFHDMNTFARLCKLDLMVTAAAYILSYSSTFQTPMPVGTCRSHLFDLIKMSRGVKSYYQHWCFQKQV